MVCWEREEWFDVPKWVCFGEMLRKRGGNWVEMERVRAYVEQTSVDVTRLRWNTQFKQDEDELSSLMNYHWRNDLVSMCVSVLSWEFDSFDNLCLTIAHHSLDCSTRFVVFEKESTEFFVLWMEQRIEWMDWTSIEHTISLCALSRLSLSLIHSCIHSFMHTQHT